MAKKLKRTKGSCVSFVLLFFILHMDGTQADSTNSSTAVSSDGQISSDLETTVEKGMKPFFDMVKSFLVVVQPHKISEQPWLNISEIYTDGKFHFEQFKDSWQDIATYLIGFLVCAAVGVLFFVILPITGIIFCCCRCCGKCGGRPKPNDPKRAGCKRKSYCTLLLLLNTISLAGVVCAFLSNEMVYEKFRGENNSGPVDTFSSALENIADFANTTVAEIEKAVLGRFEKDKEQIINLVRNTANDAVGDALDSLNATSLLAQTRNLSIVVNRTRDVLINMAEKLRILSSHGSWLANNLSQIADNVSAACHNFSSSTNCGNFQKDNYKVTANFSHLDDLSDNARTVAQSVNLSQYIREAEERIEITKSSTTQNVETRIKEAEKSVDGIQDHTNTGVEKMKSEVKTSVTGRTGKFDSQLKDVHEDVSQFGKYWWIGGLVVSCILLLVIILYYVGVLFGLCGERPGVGAQCCNKGTGANFLMAGVGFTFLLAWLIMLVCIVLFIVGGPVYTELCRYFIRHEPEDLQPFDDAVTQIVDFQKILFGGKDVKLDFVDILNGCKNNGPIYTVMKLENLVNLTEYTNFTTLKTSLSKLQAESLTIPNITILTSQLNGSIENFASSGLDAVNFTEYYTEVNNNLTAGDLNGLAANLRSIASQQTAQDASFRTTLLTSADQLENLQRTVVIPMIAAVNSLRSSLAYLESQSKSQIQTFTSSLLEGLQTAQDNFNVQKDILVKKHLVIVIAGVLAVVEGFVHAVLTDVNENIGKCRPIFDAFFSSSDAVCVDILDPLNGFWFSLGWCLFFFIPCLIFAVKLAGLYRREEEEKDFDDPNFILYGNGNQDTIPLTSLDHGHPLAYPGPGVGMINSAFHRDSYLAPPDKYAPPPYSVNMNGSRAARSKDMDQTRYPY